MSQSSGFAGRSKSYTETHPESGTDTSAEHSSPLLPSMPDADQIDSLNIGFVQKSFRRRYWLQLLFFFLHIGLVLVQVAFLVTGLSHWEHKITFPLQHQSTVSFWATEVTTTFVTKLAMRWNIMSSQPLTKTHDSIASWAGLGSALATLYSQLSVPLSVFGSLHVVGYLGCITALHIITPTIFSVATFNSSVFVTVDAVGTPQYANLTTQNATNAFMKVFPTGFLPWIGNLDGSQALGLFNNTMYEVLNDAKLGSGEAQVSAIGTNITCGYLPAVLNSIDIDRDGPAWNITLGSLNTVYSLPDQNILYILGGFFSGFQLPKNSIILYTPNIVVDSEGQTGSPLRFEPVNNTDAFNSTATITQLQFLQCSKSLIHQSGTVDSQSRILKTSSLSPNIYKTSSKWALFDDIEFDSQDSTMLGSDLWSDILTAPVGPGITGAFPSVEEYLIEHLNLDPLGPSSTVPAMLTLHDIENALSALVTTLFWIGGHVQPDQLTMNHAAVDSNGANINLTGVRVWLGLATSTILMLLCVMILPGPVEVKTPIQAIGLLQTIWLLQNHPAQPHVLVHVKEPTNLNLRAAGAVVIQLAHRTAWNHTGDHKTTLEEEKTANLGNELQFPAGNIKDSSVARVEHNIVFSAGLQKNVSFWVQNIASASGTIYYSALLYCTQKLAIACASQRYSTITSTHDELSSWAGIGSSLSTLYRQLALPTSVFGTFSVFAYLAAISLLQVTTPALFPVETFNPTVSKMVTTQKNLPQFLPWIASLSPAQTLGLSNGSLYDILTDVYPGNSTATVSAVGWNITCGYLPGTNVNINITDYGDIFDGFYNISFTSTDEWVAVPAPGPNIITLSAMKQPAFFSTIADPGASSSITVYTTNDVVDSHGQTGLPIALTQPGTNHGIVDAASKKIIPSSLQPNIQKDNSNWHMYNSTPHDTSDQTLLQGGSWAQILANLFTSEIALDQVQDFSLGDVYLMSQLGLNPVSGSDSASSQTLKLHDIENALSNLVSSVFWIGAHVQLPPLAQQFGENNFSETSATRIPVDPPGLVSGEALLQQVSTAARINISLLAVSFGLCASILMLILSITMSVGGDRPVGYLNGLGLLQIIWVFQHHPELSQILQQVEDPTDYNLRVAGLVTVRLADAEEQADSFL
ncbi:hypothetical protein C8R44DRAFT_725953 [Mycena epipterygia]|nr:hypothetical protein C8R44DRAFT_725953 [Mycena epipterygia]